MSATPIRVAIVVPDLDGGGGVPALADFLYKAAESAADIHPELYSLPSSADDPLSVRLRSPSTWMRGPVVASGMWRGRPYTRVGCACAEIEFARYFSRRALGDRLARADVVQVVCGSPAWANAVIGCGRPVSALVATRAIVERQTRDSSPTKMLHHWRKWMTAITDKLDDRALRGADAVQVLNAWMLDYARGQRRGMEDGSVAFVPPGIDAVKFSPGAYVPSRAQPYILCVGRLNDPRKNVVLLLKAFARLATKHPALSLVTAGHSVPPAEYWALADALNLRRRISHVETPGEDELVSLYRGASAFALSSNEEGLGVVLLEAMACGVPVVATRCGGPEGVITDGRDGFLVPVGDEVAMSERLDEIVSDPEGFRAVAIAGRQTIVERFSDQIAGRFFLEIWRGFAGRRLLRAADAGLAPQSF